MSETEVRRRLTALRRRMQDRQARSHVSGVRRAAGATTAWRPGETIDACERELLELLVVYPEYMAGGRARRLRPEQLASPGLRRIYETGCRLLDVGVLPDFDRLILEFDDPALKSLLVDLDEQGRAKGSRHGRSGRHCWSELIKAFQRKEVEKQRPGQMVALREGQPGRRPGD